MSTPEALPTLGRGTGIARAPPAEEPSAHSRANGGCDCEGGSWPRIFLHFVTRHKVVPLGLFRDRRWKGASLPYVHTNPCLSARCRIGDVVFVVVPVSREEEEEET